jgi:hypothetical protein
MEMKSALIIVAFVVLGLALGYGVGFATCVVGTMADSPILPKLSTSPDGFTSVFKGMGSLGAAELAAGICGRKRIDPLAFEDDAIRAIQDRAAAAGLNPPLDVARARLALRRAVLAEQSNDMQLKTKYEEDAGQLLQKSGWKDPSADHLRMIMTQQDQHGKNTCGPSEASGGQPQ